MSSFLPRFCIWKHNKKHTHSTHIWHIPHGQNTLLHLESDPSQRCGDHNAAGRTFRNIGPIRSDPLSRDLNISGQIYPSFAMVCTIYSRSSLPGGICLAHILCTCLTLVGSARYGFSAQHLTTANRRSRLSTDLAHNISLRHMYDLDDLRLLRTTHHNSQYKILMT